MDRATAPTAAQLRSNLPRIFAFNFSFMFLVAIPVVVPYWQAHGLTLHQVFQLQAIFGAVVLCLDVPLGYVSDVWGRKGCLVLVGLMNGLAFSTLSLARSFAGFAFFEVLAALAVGLYSGCDFSMLYETVEALEKRHGQKPPAMGELIGRRFLMINAGEGTAALVAGALTFLSPTLPIRVQGFVAWAPLLIALTLHEPPRARLAASRHRENFRLILRSLFRHSRLLNLLLANFVLYGFSTYAAVWAFQSFWKQSGVPLTGFGFLWGAQSLLSGAVARLAPRIERRLGSVRSLILIAALPVFGYLGMGWSPGLVAVALGFWAPVCRGLTYVIYSDAINARVPSEIRATANSFAGLGARALFVVFGPGIGYALDQAGFRATFTGLSLCYVAVFLALCLPLLGRRGEFRPLPGAPAPGPGAAPVAATTEAGASGG